MPPKQYQTIEQFLGDLDPALAPVLHGVRSVILAAALEVREGIAGM